MLMAAAAAAAAACKHSSLTSSALPSKDKHKSKMCHSR